MPATPKTREDVNAERITAHTDHLKNSLGIVHAPQLYALGRPVNSWGTANALSRRTELDDMPLIVDALDGVAAAVASENRRDLTVDVHDLEMLDDGAIRRRDSGKAGLMLERNGLRQIIARNSQSFPRAQALMTALQADTRAAVFNDQIRRGPNNRLKLRVRQNPGTGDWQLYSVVTPKYATFDADKSASVMKQGIIAAGHADTLRGEVIYSPDTTGLYVNGFYRTSTDLDTACGEIIEAGISMWSKDDGTGAIHGRGTSLRNLCLNLIILDAQTASLFSIRHTGSTDRMALKIRAGLERGTDFLNVFAKDWGYMKSVTVWDVLPQLVGGIAAERIEDIEDGEKRLKALFKALAKEAPVARDTAVEVMLRGYDAEPAASLDKLVLTDVVNAVTRVHEQAVPVSVNRGMEAWGGQLSRQFAAIATD